MNPKLNVRVDETYGEIFLTTLGIMQGDCLSVIKFIFYIGCCLAIENEEIDKSSLLIKPNTRMTYMYMYIYSLCKHKPTNNQSTRGKDT